MVSRTEGQTAITGRERSKSAGRFAQVFQKNPKIDFRGITLEADVPLLVEILCTFVVVQADLWAFVRIGTGLKCIGTVFIYLKSI